MLELLTTLFLILLIGGLLYWLVGLLPMPQPFKTGALVVLILIVVVWLLHSSGLVGEHAWRVRW